jgi:uncharacterized protein YhbP (UPF0306 family)
MSESRDEILQTIADLLKSQSTMVISTCETGGWPHATPLFYLAGSQFELYWFSSPSSLHSENAARTSRASVAIHVSTTEWQQIRGVQMRGTVHKITQRIQRREISKAYRARFNLGGVLFRAAMAKSSLYVFRPCWIRYLDNTRGFGFKFEADLPIMPDAW